MADDNVMPSRRTVLAYGALAGSALALGVQVTRAGASDDRKLTFALVSDNHLGRDGKEESAVNMRRAVEELNTSHAQFTIFCGDLVNAGQEPKNQHHYQDWKRIAESLKHPWRAIPGNHDPVDLFKAQIQEHTDFVIDRAGFRLVCFNDAKPNPQHQGAVAAEQVRWIQQQTDDAKTRDLRVILVSHITHHDNKSPNRGWMIKDGRKDFSELLSRNNGTIAAFFAGHFHYGLHGWEDNKLPQIVIPSTSWNSRVDLKAVSDFAVDDFRPAYLLVDADPQKLILRHKPIGDTAKVVRELKLS